jgi:hypothetical protein
MTLSWQPSETFETLARQSGLPLTETMEAQRAEFVSYWIGQGEKLTAAGWDHKFLKNMLANKAKSYAKAKAKAKGKTNADSRQDTLDVLTGNHRKPSYDGESERVVS